MGSTRRLTSGAFLQNVVFANINPIRLEILAANLTLLTMLQLGPLMLTGVYVLRRLRSRQGQRRDWLLICYWLIAWIPVAGLVKVGSSQNYWIELAAISAVLATSLLWSQSAGRSQGYLSIGLLAISVATTFAVEISSIAAMFSQHPPDASLGPAFQSLVRRVEVEPGEVLSEPLDAAVLAGRGVLLEPYIYSILHREGQWDAEPIVRRICDGSVTMVVLGYPVEQLDRETHGYTLWPRPVIEAIQATMVLDSELANRFIYRRGVGAGQACGKLG